MEIVKRDRQIVVEEEPGKRLYNNAKGIIFEEDVYNLPEGEWRVYRSVETKEEIKRGVLEGMKGKQNDAFMTALVRHGTPGHWDYYPLKLLFEESNKRHQMEKLMGLEAHNDHWVERKVKQVKAYLAVA